MDLFKELLPSLNQKTEHLLDLDPSNESGYNPYIVNKVFSFGVDTVMYANEMNMHPHLSKKMQYDFYYYGLEKKRRYNKWIKQKDINNIELVKEFYACSTTKAKQYLKILTEDDIEYLNQCLGKADS